MKFSCIMPAYKNPVNFISVFVLMLTASYVQAQSYTNSSYSRYGLGDQMFHGMAHQFALGGSGIAADSNFHLNLFNPASYSSLQLTTVEAGVFSNTTEFKSAGQAYTRNNTSLHYVAFGFPVKRWWGLSFGLQPYTAVGYNITDTMPASTGNAVVDYSGYGGLNKVYLGNGISFLNDSVYRAKGLRLSLGFNVNYFYGSIFQQADISYPDVPGSLNARNERIATVSDFSMDYGLQFKFMPATIKGKKLIVGLGITSELGKGLHARTDEITRTFLVSGEVQTLKDTVFNESNTDAELNLPASYGGGISVAYGNKWTLVADYRLQDWTDFTFNGVSDSLGKAQRISAGIDFIPDNNSNNFFKQTHYRIGAYLISGPVNASSETINEQAVTVGFGIPLKKTRSTINIAAAFGTRGSTLLVQERFIKATIGFTLNDRWFIRRKFD